MKKAGAVILTAVMALVLSSCGLASQRDFDAGGYVQAALDAKYKQEYQAYAESVGVNEEEAREQMEKEFQDSLEEQITQSGLTATDEEKESYFQLEAELRGKIRYEVQEAVRDEDDNYTVDVIVTPVNAYDLLGERFPDMIQEAVDAGADESAMMGVFLECFQGCVDDAQELDQKTVTLHVTHEDEGLRKVYTIDEDDVLNFDYIATNTVG